MLAKHTIQRQEDAFRKISLLEMNANTKQKMETTLMLTTPKQN